MKHNKLSAITSLVFTLIPFVSALITNYIQLPYHDVSVYKIVMTTMFAGAWAFLCYFFSTTSEETLYRLKLVKKSADILKGYWFIKYKDNPYCSCSLVKICDCCEGDTKSNLTDYNLDLTEKESALGIDNLEFNSDKRLSLMYTSGGQRYSSFRTTYSAGNYDVIRIVETVEGSPIKIIGCMEKVTSDALRDVGICKNEKLAKQMLKKFLLTKENIKSLLPYMQDDNNSFSQTVMNGYHRRGQQFGSFYNTVRESETKPDIESTNSEKIISSK